MSELVKQGSQYTDDQRKDAAVQYAIGGVMSVVSAATDIPETTLATWKNKSDWWDDIVAEVRSQNADSHISQYQELTRKALEKASEGIDKLPDKLSAGDIKALVVAGATTTDKALLLQGKATSISGKSGADSMEQMRKKFEAFEDQYQAQKKILDGTVVSSQDSTKGPKE